MTEKCQNGKFPKNDYMKYAGSDRIEAWSKNKILKTNFIFVFLSWWLWNSFSFQEYSVIPKVSNFDSSFLYKQMNNTFQVILN